MSLYEGSKDRKFTKIFELNNEISPVVLKTPDKPNYLGIIMPLKL